MTTKSGSKGSHSQNISLGDRFAAVSEEIRVTSFVITDPLFVNLKNPEQGKLQLVVESPALKQGFKQIPFDKIGLYKSGDRTGRQQSFWFSGCGFVFQVFKSPCIVY
jgi:hypothetical protein